MIHLKTDQAHLSSPLPDWRSVAISWLRLFSLSACQSWLVSSAPVTVSPTWVWLRRSAVQSWRQQCSSTLVGTSWRCPILSSMQPYSAWTAWHEISGSGFFGVILILSLKINYPYLRCLNKEEKEQVVQLRTQGDGCLCSLRKENLTSWNDPETERARHIFVLDGSEDSGEWCLVTELPFTADKWCFTTVVLYNYLYIIGGYRHRVKRGWEFKMASFRFNPLTLTWVAIAPLIKVRQPSKPCQLQGKQYKSSFLPWSDLEKHECKP